MVSVTSVLKSGTQAVVLTLDDAKDQLNITHTYQDDLISSYIDAAVAAAEAYTSRCLLKYEVTINTTKFINGLRLAITPYLEALEIKYYDENNDLQTLNNADYVLTHRLGEAHIAFNSPGELPVLNSRLDAVVITYEAGYDKAADIPKQYGQFCRLLVGTFYEQRTDSVDKLPRLSYNLIHPFKLQWQ